MMMMLVVVVMVMVVEEFFVEDGLNYGQTATAIFCI